MGFIIIHIAVADANGVCVVIAKCSIFCLCVALAKRFIYVCRTLRVEAQATIAPFSKERKKMDA